MKNKQELEKKLQEILQEIYLQEDPQTLTEYRRFFKKKVRFLSRTLVAAYLFKKYVANTLKSREPSSKHSSRTESSNTQNKSKRISVNVGSQDATEKEILQFLVSLPHMQTANISLYKQTPRHTVFYINPNSTMKLIQGVKKNQFKNKKLFVDLKGAF